MRIKEAEFNKDKALLM